MVGEFIRMRSLVKLYDKALEWSAHPRAPQYLAAVSFVEASIFPIPPYVMLAPMALAKPQNALRYALIATICSVLGGVLGYILGMVLFEPLIMPLLENLNYVAKYQHVADTLQVKGFWAVLIAGFTPLPFKFMAIASGVMRIPLPAFICGALFGRAAKFYGMAAVIKFGGSKMEEKIRLLIEKLGIVLILAAAGAAMVAMSGCVKEQSPARVVKAKPNVVQQPQNVNRIAIFFTKKDKNLLAKKTDKNVKYSKGSTLNTKNPATKSQNLASKSKTQSRNLIQEKIDRKNNTDNAGWLWPTHGTVLTGFASNKKGIDIGGQEGSSIMAVKDGEVVYSGNALRGYGNLVIIKHPNNYLTAYAHNRKNFVKEGDKVKRGQKIAELGRTGSEIAKLHFEVRSQGKPIDPVTVLPKR